VLWLDGHPRLLLAGEYPYYRDDPQRWSAKLQVMREVGLEVVSFYVPWRHHELTDGIRRFDRDGNRNLVAFLKQISQQGLYALPKPGPFVHAELQFGGLPDRVSPSVNPAREAAVSARGEPLCSQRLILPAADDPAFVDDVCEWLRAAGNALRPFLYPDGPIVAVQVGNEGNYGETALAIDAVGYSASGIAAFRAFTGGIDPPARWPAPGAAGELLPFLRWGTWSAETLAAALRRFASCLDLDVPTLANLSPPPRAARCPAKQGGRYDAWVARSQPERHPDIHYGYTNWTGNALVDDEALVNSVLAAKRRRGPNLEENWSLRWVDPACAFAVVPVFHALLGLACGATGIDVYTACATDHWGNHLVVDREFLRETTGDPCLLDPPYGDAAPIDARGCPGTSFDALRVLTHFLSREGPAMVQARPEPGITWWLYPPFASLRAWDPPADNGIEGCPSVASTLVPFVTHCLHRGIPFALENLETGGPRAVDGPVVVASGFFMAEAAQERLATFVEDGGALLLLGQVPLLDDHFRPCTLLADTLRQARALSAVIVAGDDRDVDALIDVWLALLPAVRTQPADRSWLELRLVSHDEEDVFVFVASRLAARQRVVTAVGGCPVAVDLAPHGCAVVRVSGGRLRACYVKGVNEQAGIGIPVEVQVGPDRITSTHPCDLSVVGSPGGFEVRTAGGEPANRITLPVAW
jgi:beta-galactosidase